MEMTTPVISTGGQSGPDGDKMQFPMENKFGTDPDVLPLPDDSRYVACVYNCVNAGLLCKHKQLASVSKLL